MTKEECEIETSKAIMEMRKRIAELEKENAELKEELTKKADTNHSLVEQMADLESENAELKEELKDANKKVVHLACNQNKDLKRKINKAKELLKKVLDLKKVVTKAEEYLLLEEAEQFLEESE